MIAGSIKDAGLKHPTTASLVIEVSDSTLESDLGEKAALYAEAGIPDYWVVDITGRRVIVHRQPQGDKYMSLLSFSDSETISALSSPDLPVMVSQLLP